MTTTPVVSAASEDAAALAMLRELEAELAQMGTFTTRLLTQAGHVPALLVLNTSEKRLSERISAQPADGRWLFWWSWAEPVADSAAEAAARISRVLRAR